MVDKESRLLTPDEVSDIIDDFDPDFQDSLIYNLIGFIREAQDAKSVRMIVDRLEKMLKYSPVKTMAVRRELGNFIQTLKEGIDG